MVLGLSNMDESDCICWEKERETRERHRMVVREKEKGGERNTKGKGKYH